MSTPPAGMHGMWQQDRQREGRKVQNWTASECVGRAAAKEGGSRKNKWRRNTVTHGMASRVLTYFMQLIGQHVARHAVEYIANIIKEGQHTDIANNAARALKQSKITIEEARQILHLPESASLEEALQKYKYLYEKNEEVGAKYIQGRVYRAMERIEMEHGGGPITGGGAYGSGQQQSDEEQKAKSDKVDT